MSKILFKQLVIWGILALWANGSILAATREDSPKVTTRISALEAYEYGFAWNTIRAPNDQGVILNNMMLIENDGPGAGFSQKGPFRENIHIGTLVRKTLHLDNPRASQAYVVILMKPLKRPRTKQAPYSITLNGHLIKGQPIAAHEGSWHWVPVSPAHLKAGPNTVIVASDAPKDEGYALYIAREDEYEKGGGFYTYRGNTSLISADQISLPKQPEEHGFKRILVGQTSAKSIDGGKSWAQGKLGTNNDVVGEYTIRLSLEQYQPSGYVRSSPMDLWDGLQDFEFIKPKCEIKNLKLIGTGETPKGTKILWSVRFADTPDMGSHQWSRFQRLGSGAHVSFEISDATKRYMQWQAELISNDPLQTPILNDVTVERELTYAPLRERTFFVQKIQNVKHRYRSFQFTYERYDHPELKQLRKRLKLNSVLKGARGDFEKINRVRHHVAGQWPHQTPDPNYPEWNAHDILDRKKQLGSGGMCIQFAVVFMQSLQSLGYHPQFYNLSGHESTEVWVDELGKWVHIDAWGPSDSYEYNTKTGEPLNILEQHQYFLRRYGFSAQNPIAWMEAKKFLYTGENNDQPLYTSTFTPECNNPERLPAQHRLIPFARTLTRNDFLSRPFPRPLNQGLRVPWPWNGYLNWYDDATPRKLQYALHSDRKADFHPTLNQVEFNATHGTKEGEINIEMITFTPNLETFEINVDGQGWEPTSSRFVWKLRPSAFNTLEMRIKNKLAVTGKPSLIQILWNYAAPFNPEKK